MSASISVSGYIKSSGVTVENEPIILSDGVGAVTQWDNSTQGAGKGIYFVEGGSAGDPLRLGIGVAAPTVALDVAGATKFSSTVVGDTPHANSGAIADFHINKAAGAKLILTRTTADNNGTLGTIQFGNTDTDSTLAKIIATEAGSATSSKLELQTQATGAAAATRLTIDSSGRVHVGAGTASQVNLNVTGTTGTGGVLCNALTSGFAGNGDTLGSYGFKCTDSANTLAASEAKISAIAAEAHSGSTAATDLAFYTKPTGTGPGSAPTERLRIASDGAVSIPSATAAGSHLTIGNVHGKLTFSNNSGTAGTTNIQQTYSSGTAELRFGSNVATTTSSAMNISTGDAGAVKFNGPVTLAGTVTVGSLDIGHGANGDTASTAVGTDALDASVSGSTRNTAIGQSSLTALNHADADYNVAVGAYAGQALTSGDRNTSVGDSALGTVDGHNNTAVGQAALNADCVDNNTAVGKHALVSFTGSDATAVGSGAADAATTAADLTAVGKGAAGALTEGDDNTVIGTEALE